MLWKKCGKAEQRIEMRAMWWGLMIPKVIGYVLSIGVVAGVLAMILNVALCRISEHVFKKKIDRFIKVILILIWIITVIIAVRWYIRKLNAFSYEIENLEPWMAVFMLAGIALIYLIIWGMWSLSRSDKKETDSGEEIETSSSDSTEEQIVLSEMSDGEDGAN